MPRKVNVIGVGMVPFAKPGKSEEYHVMAAKAGKAALADAKVPYDQVQQAFAGYVLSSGYVVLLLAFGILPMAYALYLSFTKRGQFVGTAFEQIAQLAKLTMIFD